MPNAVWSKAITASSDPQRARHFCNLLSEKTGTSSLANVSAEQIRILATVFGGSEALSNSLIAHPEWLNRLEPETLKFSRRKQGFAREMESSLRPWFQTRNYESALKQVREFKQHEMLRIGARDLARLANAIEITQELSDLADVCLHAVWSICLERLSEKYGKPFHQDAEGNWQATNSCVLGMGKLGGQELNYSSDVDVLFVYSEEGSVHLAPPGSTSARRGGMTNHQFYCRLSETFIAEVSRMAPEGMLYRIDLRLRPEGDSGPLARSLASYENYYAQWGQTWERMMMIKTRGVAGDQGLAGEFLEMIQPFRYARSISPDVLREVAGMKDRIENEVVKEGELERNVKLGRGGIREIEFIAQSQQLLHAGRQPFLQGAQTVPCLEKLAQYELLEYKDAAALREAYCFLRDVEHRLQMEKNLQTHTIPSDRKAQGRLARLMGFATLKKFESSHRAHRAAVRRVFEKVLHGHGNGSPAPLPFPQRFEGAEKEWKRILADHGFRDLDKAFRVLREFVEGPGYVHVSARTQELARKLLPRLLSSKVQGPKSKVQGRESEVSGLKPEVEGRESPPGGTHRLYGRRDALPLRSAGTAVRRLSDPDRVVTRLDSFIGVYGARSTLFELWNSNPGIFDLLVLLFDRSEFLAELAIRTPDLVDELVTSGRLRERKTSAETLEDLRYGINDADQHAWIRKYHQAELMRIGLRDILGLADEEQYLVELSALADACLQYALGVVVRKHLGGKEPDGKVNKLNRLNELNELNARAPFAVIGLGKLGGAEIDYGSDLDILFVAAEFGVHPLGCSQQKPLRSKSKHPKGWTPNKEQSLFRLAGSSPAMLGKMAAEVMDLLSKRTEDGIVFHTDARLRPDGEKGLLVNTLKAYEEYYRHRAALWEIQSLTRTRAVAGNVEIGAIFQKMAAELTDFQETSNFKLQTSGKLQASSIKSPEAQGKGKTGGGVDTQEAQAHRRKEAGRFAAAYTPQWKEEIHRMRMRIEKERTPAGKDALAIKTGKGGLVDAEFVAQALCLENGWHEANTLRSLQKAASIHNSQLTIDKLIAAYRKLRRVEGILRRWSYEGETVLPDDPAAYYRVAVRCGFETAEEFRQAVARWRVEIREGYQSILGAG